MLNYLSNRSVSLIIQAVLPCLLFAGKKSEIKIKGGTNVNMAPPIDYVNNVFSSLAKNFGIDFSCKVLKRLLSRRQHF